MWTKRQVRLVGAVELVIGVIALGVSVLRQRIEPLQVVMSFLIMMMGVGFSVRGRRP